MPRLGLLFLAMVVLPAQAHSSTRSHSLDWVTRDALPPEHRARLPSFCSGDYLPPSLAISHDNALHVESERANFKETVGATFTGNVQLQQSGKQVQADEASYDQPSGAAQFKGNVLFRNGEISMASKQLNYNTQTGQAQLEHAKYVIAPLHMRGAAQSLTVNADDSVHLMNSSYTFCEPGQNDWDIMASEINLQQAQNYGEAYHARLRIKDVPVLYLPYFRFPLSQHRLSGFLSPQISLSASGVSQRGQLTPENTEINLEHFATPFYFNIAPNYDDTLTPRYLDGHGLLLENEFRYLNVFGEGELSLGFIGNDSAHDSGLNVLSTDDELDAQRPAERWSKALYHTGTFGQHWQERIHYEEVSDGDYSDDFSALGLIERNSHLKQNIEVEYNDGNWQLLTLMEQYQTPDQAITVKPYHRLPQIQLSRLGSYQVNQFNYELNLEGTLFTRDHEDLNGVAQIDSERLHGDVTVSYPFEKSYGFITPRLTVMHTRYRLQNLDSELIAAGYQNDVQRDAHLASIDGGLFFERNLQWFGDSFIQTLEPRIMLAHIPRVEQRHIPIFDTTKTSFNYGQLFEPNRFSGIDRVGDTQQVSLGLTTRFLNHSGLEVFRASLGQIRYLQDRSVTAGVIGSTLAEEAPELSSSSSIAAEIQWLFSPGWRAKADIQYDPHAKQAIDDTESDEEPIEKASAQLNYQSDNDWLLDLNFSHVEASKQKQLGLAFFAPVNDRWAFYAQKKHDIWPYSESSRQDKEKIEEHFDSIEGLLGIEYQNCCWRVQVTYEEHTRSDNTKDYQYLFQLHLKGLGILGTDSDKILQSRIYGYENRDIHDY
ncbi:MAG: LPS assembly protein LptD [Bermanella sp.]